MHFQYNLFILCFLSLQPVLSQTCCSGGIPLSNNLGLLNEGKGNLQLGFNYDFNNLNTLNSGQDKLNDRSRQRITHSILGNLGYSISDKLSVEVLLSWVNQRRAISQFGNTDLQQTSGIGDAVFLAKYDLPNLIGSKSNLSMGVGAKIPLGSFEEVDASGITYIADLQPGSGAWDLILFASFSKSFDFRPTTTFSGRLIARLTGENKDYFDGASSYEYGDEIQVFLGLTDQILFANTITNPGLNFKYRNVQKDIIVDNELDNTGGDWLFVIPSLGFSISPNIRFQAMAEIPLIANVDGTQLTPTYRITSGFLFSFVSSTNSIIPNIEN